jgi:DNA-binding XRE family transcriptional regulator
MELKDRIREVRKSIKPKLTQESFGNILGTSRDSIATYETGRVVPSDTFIQLLCSKFSINDHWLRTGEGKMIQENDSTLFSTFSKRYGLTEEEQAVARYCLSLSPEQRHDLLQHVLNVADAIKAARPAPEEKPDQVETEVEAYRQELKAQEKGLSASATTKEKRA